MIPVLHELVSFNFFGRFVVIVNKSRLSPSIFNNLHAMRFFNLQLRWKICFSYIWGDLLLVLIVYFEIWRIFSCQLNDFSRLDNFIPKLLKLLLVLSELKLLTLTSCFKQLNIAFQSRDVAFKLKNVSMLLCCQSLITPQIEITRISGQSNLLS